MKIEIEINDETIKERVTEMLVTRVVNYYFNCDHIIDYDQRRKEQNKVAESFIKKVDWQKVSTETFTDIAKELIASKIMKKDWDDDY